MKRRYRIFLWVVVVVVAILAFLAYWHHSLVYPSTDDAYTNANVAQVAPQVTGPVAAIYIKNYQQVTAGQKLLVIDQRPFRIALAQAEAQLALAEQKMSSEIAEVATARANVEQRQAELVLAQHDQARILKLVGEGQASQQQGDQVISQEKSAAAALVASQYQLNQAVAILGTPGEENADVRAARAAVSSAKLNLSYTVLKASVAGRVVNFTTRIGQVITAAEPIFQIVDDQHWWVDANFKETQLERVRSGQSAVLEVDMYPNHPFHGTVYRVSPGSGAAFSVLPPENATGNWVKVTQRFPVRIEITDVSPNYPLGVGASVNVTVDTTKS